jgi:polar amino acid transport system permease protein
MKGLPYGFFYQLFKGGVPISDIIGIFPQLAQGLQVTVTVLIGSAILAYLMAFIAGFSRLSRNVVLRKFTGFYVEVFRGTSLIVQLFWLYYAIPMLFGFQLGSNWWTGVIAIGLNYGAYLSEVVRSSIVAVHEGQREAAVALNMSRFQRMRLIIFPQAVRMMLPEFGNYTIQMLKGTSLVSLIGMMDILYYGDLIRSSNLSQAPLVYVLILIFYFILALPLIWLTRKAEKLSKKGVASG